jgi:hypothetical protein
MGIRPRKEHLDFAGTVAGVFRGRPVSAGFF